MVIPIDNFDNEELFFEDNETCFACRHSGKLSHLGMDVLSSKNALFLVEAEKSIPCCDLIMAATNTVDKAATCSGVHRSQI